MFLVPNPTPPAMEMRAPLTWRWAGPRANSTRRGHRPHSVSERHTQARGPQGKNTQHFPHQERGQIPFSPLRAVLAPERPTWSLKTPQTHPSLWFCDSLLRSFEPQPGSKASILMHLKPATSSLKPISPSTRKQTLTLKIMQQFYSIKAPR